MMIRSCAAIVALGSVCLAWFWLASSTVYSQKQQVKLPEGDGFLVRVNPGSPTSAGLYYFSLTAHTGFETGYDNKGNPTGKLPHLDDLLAYAGYKQKPTLSAEEAETLDSDKLIAVAPADILSVRFFAPKITDVSGRITPPALGWRRVVRLKARVGSEATKKGIASVFLLFNHFQPEKDLANDPFTNRSPNNQVMLIRASGAALPDAAYWLVFDSLVAAKNPGKLITFLNATFDARDPALGQPAQYHVPDACAVCHGVRRQLARLNYLDTDHWYDRVQKGEDFEVVGNSKHGVVFDGGGNDTTTPAFKTAFARIQQMNQEIYDQAAAVDPTYFQTKAAKHWLDLHAKDIAFLSPFRRSLPGGLFQWDEKNPVDQALLPLLNRYCYRCHSSVVFHVFDKTEVANKKTAMKTRINLPDAQIRFRMPQDRNLPEATKKTISDLLDQLP